MGGIFTLPLPVRGQVGFRAEGLTTLRALVRLHRSVEPLVFQEFKTVFKAPSTQGTVVCDSSPRVDRFDRRFPGGHRCRGGTMSEAALPVFTYTQ